MIRRSLIVAIALACALVTPSMARQSGSTSLNGIVEPLKSKALEIVRECRSTIVSTFRPGARIAGTNHRSLHGSHRAVDIKGNPACIYAHLAGWRGGYSTDYRRVQHVHISYAPDHYEFGKRFAHYGARKQARRAARVRYARAAH